MSISDTGIIKICYIVTIKKHFQRSVLNGGLNASKFKLLVIRLIKYLFTSNVANICSMIEKLGVTT